MNDIFFTVTGTAHKYGHSFVKEGTVVLLQKEPENEYDSEAISVSLYGLGKIGYVANSPFTVKGDSMSAGRLYDKIDNTAFGVVMYNMRDCLFCVLKNDTDSAPEKETGKSEDKKRKRPVENKITVRGFC